MHRVNNLIFVFMIGLLALSGCNLGGSKLQTEVPIDDNPPIITEVTFSATDVPIQHAMIPGELPADARGVAGDHDSSKTADENRAPGGDRFSFSRYERPFNRDAMDVYYPYLDIQITSFEMDDTWYYGTITLYDDGTSHELLGMYAVEIDLNVDGGGDYLILASHPTSTDWTTEGVQVWFDENNDVGGSIKNTTDSEPFSGNGFETQIFGDGLEDDHDLAWVRVSPVEPNEVQFAVKASLFDGDQTLLVGMWAGASLDPSQFDMNDNQTHEQAGASLTELEFFYPVKGLSELDNACRMAIGFPATGNEPGVCPVPEKPGGGGEQPPPPGLTCPPPSIVYCSDNGCYCLEPAG